ncbi:hypothetical protein Pint_01368 [Pistacia integerrima]|uniref:Uncharacterized protein n=1 Tax=Pistacia integerrima TaxID=434235 RepID=A0ACC0ZP96_9ROSI|nr:hypothetical protein Pint_01368 [Pistacia integerrima]
MNPCIPEWNFEVDLPVTNQNKPIGPEHDLVELLWRNGQVVLNSQTHRKPGLNPNESRQVQKQTLRESSSYGNSSNLIQDDETISWIQYPLEDSFEKEFYSNFFSELPSGPMETDKHTKQLGEEKLVKFGASGVATISQPPNVTNPVVPGMSRNTMPPPRFELHDAAQQDKNLSGFGVVNFCQTTAPLKGELGSSNGQFVQKGTGNMTNGEVRECSMMTVGSSHCGSNQVAYDLDMSLASSNGAGTTGISPGNLNRDVRKVISQSERGKTETHDATVTSSSGGSGSSFNRTSKQRTGDISRKRKSRDAGESECQSDAAELDSAGGNKSSQRSGSCRRSRAAEVHNLSERRRRDRINEKMKALQELIPHCNKTDKASMLDEAIEYLKSLQLQLQVMWLGSGMAPMMFPGVQHYMSRMGMGMGPTPLPSMPNPMHLSRVPLVDQSMSIAQAQNQAPINMFRFGSQSRTMSPPSTSCGPFTGGAATDNASLSGKTGTTFHFNLFSMFHSVGIRKAALFLGIIMLLSVSGFKLPS